MLTLWFKRRKKKSSKLCLWSKSDNMFTEHHYFLIETCIAHFDINLEVSQTLGLIPYKPSTFKHVWPSFHDLCAVWTQHSCFWTCNDKKTVYEIVLGSSHFCLKWLNLACYITTVKVIFSFKCKLKADKW